MNQHWINRAQNRTCILFFNGWGMDKNAIAHLSFDGLDICMFYNFRNIEPIQINAADYQNVILIAWSLGVWAAEQVFSKSDRSIHKSIAINGTSCPVHDQYGIPDHIFRMTLQGWNEANRFKFNRRMMGGQQNLNGYEQFMSDRSCDDQKEELQTIYTAYKSNPHNPIHWNAALVGRNDLIFPAENQRNWWTGKTIITETGDTHFPFAGLKHWNQLLNL